MAKRYGKAAEATAIEAERSFRVDLGSALALAKRLEDLPTAEDAAKGADCIKSMIRELAKLRGAAATPRKETP